jgi:DNA-binding CsgD family transcriptional regulator/tetratricopeptide (TPR) repeat protein
VDDRVVPAPRTAPAVTGRSPFVGRDALLDLLGDRLARARGGAFAGVLLGGPAGIGKSRLVEHFTGSAVPAGEAPGLLLRGAGRRDDDGLVPLEAVRALVDLAGADPTAPPTRETRERLFGAVAEALLRAADEAGVVVVVLEDLQWADATSLALVPFLVRRLASAPVLLVGTYRDGHETTPALRDLLVSLDRTSAVTRHEVGPLGPEELRDLVAARLGRQPDPSTLEQVRRRSHGITLFAEELAATVDSGSDAVPTSLRDAFLDVLDRLGAGARELADLMAVAGVSVDHELLSRVAEVSEASLEKQVDELVDAGVLSVEPGTARYRFRHDLVHETVLSALRPSARRRLHVRLARALTERPDLVGPGRSVAAELVRHWRGAGDVGRELEVLLAAAASALRSGAYDEALLLDVQALDLLPSAPPEARDGVDLAALLERAGTSASLAGDHARSAELLARAAEQVPDRREWARIQVVLTTERWLAGDAAASARGAFAALELVGSAHPRERALLLAASAWARVSPSVPGTPLTATTEALRLVAGEADPDCRSTVLSSHGLALAHDGRVGEARAALDEAERLAEDVEDARVALRPALFRMVVAQRAGASREVVVLGREAGARADRMGVSGSLGQQVRAILVDALVEVGRWDEALEVIEDALMWTGTSVALSRFELARADVLVRRGRLDEARAHLDAAEGAVATTMTRRALVEAGLAWARGDVAGSRHHAARGLQLVGAASGFDEVGPLTWALVRAVVAGPRGDDEQATLTAALAGLELLGAQPSGRAWQRTVLAEAETDEVAALAAWRQALQEWRDLDHGPMVATACVRVGALLLDDAPAEAGELLAEAARLAEALGAAPLLAQVQELCARSGQVLLVPRPRDDGEEGPNLTARELEVLRLLVEGWANKRIAAELVISPRTVAVHVSRILDKLQVTSRGEAAAAARRLGLVGHPV